MQVPVHLSVTPSKFHMSCTGTAPLTWLQAILLRLLAMY